MLHIHEFQVNAASDAGRVGSLGWLHGCYWTMAMLVQPKIRCVEACCDVENKASARVMVKTGMVAGTSRTSVEL